MEIQQQGQTITRLRAPKNPYLQLGALLGVALIAFMVTWLVMRGGSSTPGKQTLPAVGKPGIVTEAQLRTLAKQTKFPVYWAGKKSGAYELTRLSDGRIYVRYLDSATQLGTRSAKYLTVGTYPSKQAWLEIHRAARRKGGLSLKIPHGGMLVFNTATPTSVYFGYPSAKYQVEVYDPSPQQARSLVLGGKITPIR
jgi:hypothetical protein